jgi:hypothetical protein
MKSRLSTLFQRGYANAIIGCVLLTLLTPTSLLAEVAANLTDAEFLTTFGTIRRPQTCPSKSEPMTGRLSVAQAIKYTRCFFEERNSLKVESEHTRLRFVDISNFQLSPPRQATERDVIRFNVERNQPIYVIKAYAVSYFCFPISKSGSSIGGPGKSCDISGSQIRDPLNSDGVCFKDLQERWSCRLGITPGKNVSGPPPAN